MFADAREIFAVICGYYKEISRCRCGYLPLKTEFGYPPFALEILAGICGYGKRISRSREGARCLSKPTLDASFLPSQTFLTGKISCYGRNECGDFMIFPTGCRRRQPLRNGGSKPPQSATNDRTTRKPVGVDALGDPRSPTIARTPHPPLTRSPFSRWRRLSVTLRRERVVEGANPYKW